MAIHNIFRRLIAYIHRRNTMGIIQNITDDQAAIDAAEATKASNDVARAAAAAADQAAIDAANAKLSGDQATLAALAPVQAALAELKTFAATVSNDAESAQLLTLVDAATAALGL